LLPVEMLEVDKVTADVVIVNEEDALV